MTREEAWIHFMAGALRAGDYGLTQSAVESAAFQADRAVRELDKRRVPYMNEHGTAVRRFEIPLGAY